MLRMLRHRPNRRSSILSKLSARAATTCTVIVFVLTFWPSNMCLKFNSNIFSCGATTWHRHSVITPRTSCHSSNQQLSVLHEPSCTPSSHETSSVQKHPTVKLLFAVMLTSHLCATCTQTASRTSSEFQASSSVPPRSRLVQHIFRSCAETAARRSLSLWSLASVASLCHDTAIPPKWTPQHHNAP